MVSRRGFLKILGAAAAAAVAAPLLGTPASALAAPSAPLFVPSDRLGFGVPRRIVTAQATDGQIEALWQQQVQRFDEQRRIGESVPMLLVHNEFLLEYGGKLAAGSTVRVDRTTSDRWLRYGVAVPAVGHPAYGRPLPERANGYDSVRRDPLASFALGGAAAYFVTGDTGVGCVPDAAESGIVLPSAEESRLMGQQMLAEIRSMRTRGDRPFITEAI